MPHESGETWKSLGGLAARLVKEREAERKAQQEKEQGNG